MIHPIPPHRRENVRFAKEGTRRSTLGMDTYSCEMRSDAVKQSCAFDLFISWAGRETKPNELTLFLFFRHEIVIFLTKNRQSFRSRHKNLQGRDECNEIFSDPQVLSFCNSKPSTESQPKYIGILVQIVIAFWAEKNNHKSLVCRRH